MSISAKKLWPGLAMLALAFCGPAFCQVLQINLPSNAKSFPMVCQCRAGARSIYPVLYPPENLTSNLFPGTNLIALNPGLWNITLASASANISYYVNISTNAVTNNLLDVITTNPPPALGSLGINLTNNYAGSVTLQSNLSVGGVLSGNSITNNDGAGFDQAGNIWGQNLTLTGSTIQQVYNSGQSIQFGFRTGGSATNVWQESITPFGLSLGPVGVSGGLTLNLDGTCTFNNTVTANANEVFAAPYGPVGTGAGLTGIPNTGLRGDLLTATNIYSAEFWPVLGTVYAFGDSITVGWGSCAPLPDNTGAPYNSWAAQVAAAFNVKLVNDSVPGIQTAGLQWNQITYNNLTFYNTNTILYDCGWNDFQTTEGRSTAYISPTIPVELASLVYCCFTTADNHPTAQDLENNNGYGSLSGSGWSSTEANGWYRLWSHASYRSSLAGDKATATNIYGTSAIIVYDLLPTNNGIINTGGGTFTVLIDNVSNCTISSTPIGPVAGVSGGISNVIAATIISGLPNGTHTVIVSNNSGGYVGLHAILAPAMQNSPLNLYVGEIYDTEPWTSNVDIATRQFNTNQLNSILALDAIGEHVKVLPFYSAITPNMVYASDPPHPLPYGHAQMASVACSVMTGNPGFFPTFVAMGGWINPLNQGFLQLATNAVAGLTGTNYVNTNLINGTLILTGTNITLFDGLTNKRYGPVTLTNASMPFPKSWTVTNLNSTYTFVATTP